MLKLFCFRVYMECAVSCLRFTPTLILLNMPSLKLQVCYNLFHILRHFACILCYYDHLRCLYTKFLICVMKEPWFMTSDLTYFMVL